MQSRAALVQLCPMQGGTGALNGVCPLRYPQPHHSQGVESEDHRITGLRGLEGNSRGHRAQPPANAGSLQQVALKGVQMGLGYLRRRRLHHLSEQHPPDGSAWVRCYMRAEEGRYGLRRKLIQVGPRLQGSG